ncbi:MAG: hypothetical protein PVH47_04235 [Thiohalocapsa sp.]|jgi:hypothetical protein
MTTNQFKAHWELCRQGLPLAADEAAARWDEGRRFDLDNRIRVARSVEALIALCNWEAELRQRPAA